MAVHVHKIVEINPTVENLCVRIRVIRLWILPSYENSPLPYSIEMKKHVSVKMAFVSQFVNLLKEKISYQTRYFGVGLNVGNFKITHQDIPRYEFNFVSFDTLNAPEFDYTFLVDVIRYVDGIESAITLEKDDKKIIECVFFGKYAHELNTFLGLGNKNGAVVVLQFARVKIFNEKIVLQNSMYGTKIFFNLEDENEIRRRRSKEAQNKLKRRKKSFGAHFEVGAHFGGLGHAFKSVAHDQIKEEKRGPKEEKRSSKQGARAQSSCREL
ncbi:hypothetical protein Ahy_B03g064446 [Arachis hypogaea]|uniref:DUF223 domain-containing protein n=1 Tax=Arachis hypogaea TaxID=3818 RepID=A0A444ZZM4_ARAHY|nr:hypothetical protein Ahy_B03g064446 [Arachis hypogaea]